MYRFWIAVTTVVIWDLIVVAHVLLIIVGIQYVEDFIHFADTTLPVLSTLVAAILAHYFGAQSGKAPGAPTTMGTDSKAAAVPSP